MILSDISIRKEIQDGKLVVRPAPQDRDYQPASLEVHIGEDVLLEPWDFQLSHTMQRIEIPSHIACQLTGKSSLARLGLVIHATAGWIDPGFPGQITLEMVNQSKEPIKLYERDPIGQLVFHYLDQPCLRPYGHEGLGSHYVNQMGTTRSYLQDPWP